LTTDRERLAAVAAVEREGLEFYSRASRVASDPRAKGIFLRLAGDKAETVRLVGEKLGGAARASKARPVRRASRTTKVRETPQVYPRSAIEPLVCFVCGEEVRGSDVPSECPSCGASGYAFEVDIDRETALRMAIESQRRNIEFVTRTFRSVSGAEAKDFLQRLADLERTSLKELEAERRKPGG
jgi:rubrerythrin